VPFFIERCEWMVLMKLLFLIFLMNLSGCAQLMHGSPLPVVTIKDANQKLMAIDCSGLANNWGVCYDRAGNSCPAGYEVTDKQETPRGAMRELTFRCK
jgi:hypothetical protein